MGQVYAQYVCGGSDVDKTNAVCEFDGFIQYLGPINIILFNDKIVYQDSPQCMKGLDGQYHTYTIYFKDIYKMERVKRNLIMSEDPLELDVGGVRIFEKCNDGDEELIIKQISSENYAKMDSLWKRQRQSRSQNSNNLSRFFW